MADADLIPDSTPRHITLNPSEHQRVLIVGDIHGCCDEFKEMLRILKHRKDQDILILAGDLVNKGPKSVEVLRLARELGAHAVVGNHELASLRGFAARGGGSHPIQEENYAWTDRLESGDLDYIKGLSYTIHIPRHAALVVHAGIVPNIPLEEQSRFDVISMRDLLIEYSLIWKV